MLPFKRRGIKGITGGTSFPITIQYQYVNIHVHTADNIISTACMLALHM